MPTHTIKFLMKQFYHTSHCTEKQSLNLSHPNVKNYFSTVKLLIQKCSSDGDSDLTLFTVNGWVYALPSQIKISTVEP